MFVGLWKNLPFGDGGVGGPPDPPKIRLCRMIPGSAVPKDLTVILGPDAGGVSWGIAFVVTVVWAEILPGLPSGGSDSDTERSTNGTGGGEGVFPSEADA